MDGGLNLISIIRYAPPYIVRVALQRRGAAAAALLHPHSGRGREVRHRILLICVLVIYHKYNLTRSSHSNYIRCFASPRLCCVFSWSCYMRNWRQQTNSGCRRDFLCLHASGITSNERASDGRQLATKCARGSNVPFDSLGGQGGRIPLRHEHDYLTETYRRRNILYVDDGNSCASAL